MIEVRVTPSGDVAWAHDAESAVVAARTLMEDDFAAMPLQGRVRSALFLVDGEVVRGPVPEDTIRALVGGVR